MNTKSDPFFYPIDRLPETLQFLVLFLTLLVLPLACRDWPAVWLVVIGAPLTWIVLAMFGKRPPPMS